MKKIAIITGASSGMGRDFAIQLAKDYQYLNIDEIWLIARRLDRLTETEKKITEIKGSPKAKALSVDIAGKDGALRFKTLLDAEKSISGDFEIIVLVNNAGFGTYGPFEETPVEKEMEMIDLNCTSLTGITGFSLPYMNKNSFIINTASMAAFAPLGNFAVYGATKAYVLSYSLALAAELKPREISVCALCPGSVSTEFANVASNGARKEVLHGFSSEKTVRHCLKKALSGKHTAILRLKWKMQAIGSRVIDAYTIARFTYMYSKRPYKKD
ncbi:MAG: SDR family NAD(P)-dependent oxidoreductase [Treponema sp.]|nr:SDR family NAD(P)-dependent oxidoreductase [Treponema sp.]